MGRERWGETEEERKWEQGNERKERERYYTIILRVRKEERKKRKSGREEGKRERLKRERDQKMKERGGERHRKK